MKYKIQVKNLKDENTYWVDGEETLRQSLIEQGVISDYPCGGNGTCGKCRAKVLSDNMREILLCKTYPISDMEIEFLSDYSIHFDLLSVTNDEVIICYDVGTTTLEFSVLNKDGEKVAEYQLNEALNADGQMCYPEGSGFVIPFGSSADGRYAMFLVESYYYDIVITDMKTMESHVLIKGDAILDTMGTTLLPIVRPGSWHGEDYINLLNGYILMF